MVHRFTACAVTAEVDPDNDVMQVGVAEDEDGEGFFLLFMSNIGEPSRQNVALGRDSHCLVTADQGTAYGCVREVALSDRRLVVSLDPASLEELGLVDPEIEAELDVGALPSRRRPPGHVGRPRRATA
ncbi:Imm10 family immunity protein [Streptomyces sp. NPDC048324]|uniref:Imm10 family immunity protein n=1 Tax=Streptomyces sp. NPDC048324 TaxID=3157205 RepID=UPI00343EA117